MLKNVVEDQKAGLSAEHPDRLRSQQELARAYTEKVGPKEAVTLLKEVVDIEKKKLHDKYPDRLALEHELARAYISGGQYNGDKAAGEDSRDRQDCDAYCDIDEANRLAS